MGIVSTISGAYGWTREEVLDLYFLEAFLYMEAIQKDKIQDYYMQAIIAVNPKTKDPKELLKTLHKQMDDLAGVSDDDALPEPGAFDKLRRLLGSKKKQ